MEKEIIIIHLPTEDYDFDPKTVDLLKENGFVVLVLIDPSIKDVVVDVFYRNH